MIDDIDEPFALEAQTAAELAETLVVDRSSTANWPKTLVELVDVNIATLIRRGMEPIAAEELARHLVVAQSIHNGGRPVYLPRGQKLETALMHDAIFRASRRGNTDALARKYGITCRAIEMIVQKQTMLHRQRIQPSLPLNTPLPG